MGEKWGRRIGLAMRVHPTEDGNLAAGMDVRTWLSEGLLDLVVPYLGGPHDKLTDSQFSFDWLAAAARDAGAWVYSPAGRVPYDDRHYEQTIEMFRATASNLHARGADGLYLEDLKWPHDRDQYMVLREMGDPDTYARKTKHYMFAPGIDTADSAPLDRRLPVTMTEGHDRPHPRIRRRRSRLRPAGWGAEVGRVGRPHRPDGSRRPFHIQVQR